MINVETFKIAQSLCSVNADEETVTFTNSLDDLEASLSMYLLGLKAAGLMSPRYERLDLLAQLAEIFVLALHGSDFTTPVDGLVLVQIFPRENTG